MPGAYIGAGSPVSPNQQLRIGSSEAGQAFWRQPNITFIIRPNFVECEPAWREESLAVTRSDGRGTVDEEKCQDQARSDDVQQHDESRHAIDRLHAFLQARTFSDDLGGYD